VDNYDRGIHLLVGEQEFRGSHRVAIWLSALVHHCFVSDMRTEAVYLEPRVDNTKYVSKKRKKTTYIRGSTNYYPGSSATPRSRLLQRRRSELPAQALRRDEDQARILGISGSIEHLSATNIHDESRIACISPSLLLFC
jgi:hypothetical protein